jgi:hypothetical protein
MDYRASPLRAKSGHCSLDLFKNLIKEQPQVLSLIGAHEQALFAQAQQSATCNVLGDPMCASGQNIGGLRPVTLDGVPICVQYDVGGIEFFRTDDLHHRQKNGRYKNYFFKRLQRRSS